VGYPRFVVRQVKVEGVRENMGMDNVPRCQHVKVNGTQCGSPALRSRRRCYFHDRIRRERTKIAQDVAAKRRFDLPLLEDANSVQVALMKVIQMLGAGQLDHKTAGLMLYALQTASANLRNAEFEVEEVTHVVIDRDDVHRTCINGPQWFKEDFEEEEEDESNVEEEGEDEDEADGEAAVAAAPVDAEPAPEESAVKKIPTMEEARKQVQGAIRNWVLETVGEKIGVKPS
jgi:hypothetical protein